MARCHAGFSWKLEGFKYLIQLLYLLFGLFFHSRILRTLFSNWPKYSKFPFYKLFLVDSVLSVLIALLNLGVIRVAIFFPALCPTALSRFSDPSQLTSLLFVDQYLKFAKCLNFSFMMLNRCSCVICPSSYSTIHKFFTIHTVLFSLLCPLLGVWPVFLSDSQLVPFQGGFIHEYKMSFRWVSLPQFSVIISTITLTSILVSSFICLVCMSRTRSENKHTEQSLTASALCMSIFYVVVLSMHIWLHQSHASSLEMAEFWKAITMFAFDVLVVCPPVIMLCLNVRLRNDVFPPPINKSSDSPK